MDGSDNSEVMETPKVHTTVKKRKTSFSSTISRRLDQYAFTWSIKNFSLYPKPKVSSPTTEGMIVRSSEATESLMSAHFSSGESEKYYLWRLVLCPYRMIDNEEYVGVYLQKCLGEHCHPVQVKMSVVSNNDEKIHVQKAEYQFTNGGIFGWDNFIQRKVLYDAKDRLLSGDVLKLCCEIDMSFDTQVKVDTLKTIPPIVTSDCANSILGAIYKKQVCTDVILRAGAEDYKAHKAVLSISSPVFAEMFERENTGGDSGGIVKINDVAGPILERMLKYIYCGVLSEMCPDILLVLYKAAQKYALSGLVAKCSESLSATLNLNNVVEIGLHAVTFKDGKLLGAARRFIMSRATEIMATSVWAETLHKYPEAVKYLLKPKAFSSG